MGSRKEAHTDARRIARVPALESLVLEMADALHRVNFLMLGPVGATTKWWKESADVLADARAILAKLEGPTT